MYGLLPVLTVIQEKLTFKNTTKCCNMSTLIQAKDTEIRGTKFVVDGLKEGGLYRFRVRAVNAAGLGDPGLVSEMIEIKDRTSKCSTCSEMLADDGTNIRTS